MEDCGQWFDDVRAMDTSTAAHAELIVDWLAWDPPAERDPHLGLFTWLGTAHDQKGAAR